MAAMCLKERVGGLQETDQAGPFLSSAYIPDDAWRRLTPGQRLLHTLWTEKFVPLFDDYRRVRPEALCREDRQMIRTVLAAISRQRVRFRRPFIYEPRPGIDVAFLQTRGTVRNQRITTNVLVVTTDESAQHSAQWITFEAYGNNTDVKVVLEWRSQDSPERGSVFLWPRAATSKHRFGIAAFNHKQFAAIGKAFVEYLVGGSATAVADAHGLRDGHPAAW